MLCRVSTSATGECCNLRDDLPRFGDFIRVARTQHHQIRHGPQRSQLFDRLVRRAVFSDADGIVRENEDGRDLHQRGQADAGPHVIAEVEKRRAEGADARDDQPIHARAHHMLAHAKMQVAPA